MVSVSRCYQFAMDWRLDLLDAGKDFRCGRLLRVAAIGQAGMTKNQACIAAGYNREGS
jgi:hypothetical protein